ncbi:hypothetical protein CAPTEDRAFT_229039 [Capitella teleta]|uniref:Membrane protein BRI3 n=1 Tax=Capitella teleta TaxID=283909 RepID=R7UG36_CAPTE|nr:hypothetical protein CAPTEDRAFT_229039 [Capitella teleta]|eukprot:ELU05494.1 hypothetical protein CAPTEDRAFT_229039 [Capitella teleta]
MAESAPLINNQGGYQQQMPQNPNAPPPYEGPPKGYGPPGYQGAPGPNYQGPPGPYQNQPPPPGFSPGPGQHPSYMQPNTTILVQPQPNVVVVGGCPACRVGVLEDDFTCLGVCCAIFFFPIGVLCCLAMRQRRCPNCGAIFG